MKKKKVDFELKGSKVKRNISFFFGNKILVFLLLKKKKIIIIKLFISEKFRKSDATWPILIGPRRHIIKNLTNVSRRDQIV